VLFEDKIYFIGSLKEGTGGGGLFSGAPKPLNDLFVLDLGIIFDMLMKIFLTRKYEMAKNS